MRFGRAFPQSSQLLGAGIGEEIVTVSVPIITTTATAHSPVATVGSYTLDLDLIDATALITEPVITPGTADAVQIPVINRVATIAAPTMTVGSVTVAVETIDQLALLYPPVTSVAPAQSVEPGTIGSTSDIFAPSIVPQLVVETGTIDQTAVTHDPVAAIGTTQAVSLDAIDQSAVIEAPVVTMGAVTISVPFIDRTAFSNPPGIYHDAVPSGGGGNSQADDVEYMLLIGIPL